ncbi:MAG: metallophosphoesterase [Myxococcota bacterium]|nr:metallophosphoesterase [Myxococcota bacterium]
MNLDRIQRALDQAHRDGLQPARTLPAPASPPLRRLAIGDPQAPLETFLRVLEGHGALGEDGRLSSEVQLVSMGDHFDWGRPADREQAIGDGLALLSWLAAHSPEQVVILLGNHDLSRVCELSWFPTDQAYLEARARADALYRGSTVPSEAQTRAFLEEFPFLSSVEALARDLSTFSVAQRRLVQRLLEAHRVGLAHAPSPELLLVHGAVTTDDLRLMGIAEEQGRQPEVVAHVLNGFLRRVVEAWDGNEPLDLHPLHQFQSREGEGRGILYQRPAHPQRSDPQELSGPPRRRFDPRRLPRGLTQATGHIRDNKCRALLGEWARDPAPAQEGALRTLRTDGARVEYAVGVPTLGPEETGIVFLDGGMNWTAPEHYQLLDLDRRAAATRR